MKDKAMTRREVINFLGFKLPVVLLAVEILPGVARAGETYTRKTYLVSYTERNGLIDQVDTTEHIYGVVPEYDDRGDLVGARFRDIDDTFAETTHLKPGTVIYKINEKPFVFRTNAEFSKWKVDLFDMVQKKQTITVDLDMDNKPYLHVFKFE